MSRIRSLATCASLFGLAVAALPFAAGHAEGPVNVPASIASDCSAEVSTALTKFFAGVPDGATVSFTKAGCYRTEREVVIANKTGLRVLGNGAVLKRTQPTPKELEYPKANAHLRLVQLTDSVVEDLSVQGLNTVSDVKKQPQYGSYRERYEFEHAFALHGPRNLTLRHVTADSVWGDGISIGGQDKQSKRRAEGTKVLDSLVKRNGRQGISVSGVDTLIDGVTIASSRRAAIDLEPPTRGKYVDGIEIRNSTFTSHLLALASQGNGRVDRVRYHHNTIKRSGVPVITVKASDKAIRRDWQITDNVVEWGLGSSQAAFRFERVEGIVISRNALRLKERRSGLSVDLRAGSRADLIDCNWFRGGSPTTIRTDDTSTYTARQNSTGDAPPPCMSR